MATVQPDPTSPLDQARSAGERIRPLAAFEILSRAGFVARALVYGIIGAARLRPGRRARRQDHEPARRAPNGRAAPFGHLLLAAARDRPRRLLALAAVPRRPRPRPRGRRPRDRTARRARQRHRLRGAVRGRRPDPHRPRARRAAARRRRRATSSAGPAGRWLVGLAGLVLRGRRDLPVHPRRTAEVPRRLEDRADAPRVMRGSRPSARSATSRARSCSASSRVFLLKAAYDYKANEAIGLDGALAKLYNGAYGPWLLGAVALGLIAFGCFSLVEARYRRI